SSCWARSDSFSTGCSCCSPSACSPGTPPQTDPMPADIILVNGRVLTFDTTRRRAEAVAISGERIVAVGGAEIADAWRGPSTRVIDVDGGCVIPGFNDAHAHMEREGLKHQRLSLAGARSVADVLARISAAVARARPGEWIVTMPIGEPPHYFNA